MWNQEKSCIEEKTIGDTRNLTDGNLEYTTGIMENGKNHQQHYIDRYGSTITEKSKRDMSSITKMETHSTIDYQTLRKSRKENTCQIIKHQKLEENQVKTLGKIMQHAT